MNLVDKKGKQLRVGDAFGRIWKDLNDDDLDYVWFDFHGECKNMKWENLSKLIAICEEQIKSYGAFSASVTLGGPAKQQPDFKVQEK